MLGKKYSLGATFENTGEQRVKLANFDELRDQGEDIASFLNSFTPDSAYMYLHVIAMGAGEYYGCNINGDYFPERDLINRHKTFETNAKVFKEHDNKPTSPSYGTVVFAWYNHKMHRVELILAIDKIKGKEFVDRQLRGEQLEVSMGCKVKYDVCSICGNKASKASEYCDHIRHHKKEIYPDGKQPYMINYNPTFFDISIVRRRADRIAYVLSKVASVDTKQRGDYAENFFDSLGNDIPFVNDPVVYDIEEDFVKKANAFEDAQRAATKLAMIKQIKAQSVRTINNNMATLVPMLEKVEPNLPDPLLERLARNYSFADILKSLFTRAIPLKPIEATKIIIIQTGLPKESTPEVLDTVLNAEPSGEKLPGDYRKDIGALIDPFIMQRSSFLPAIIDRIKNYASLEKKAADLSVDLNQAYYQLNPRINMGMVVYPEQYNNVQTTPPSVLNTGIGLEANRYVKNPQSNVRTLCGHVFNPMGAAAALSILYAGYKNGAQVSDILNDPMVLQALQNAAVNAQNGIDGTDMEKHSSVLPFSGVHFCSAHYGNYVKTASTFNKVANDLMSYNAPNIASYALNKTAGIIDPEIVHYSTYVEKLAEDSDTITNFVTGAIGHAKHVSPLESGAQVAIEKPIANNFQEGVMSLVNSHGIPLYNKYLKKRVNKFL